MTTVMEKIVKIDAKFLQNMKASHGFHQNDFADENYEFWLKKFVQTNFLS